jgi:hypothetical protein
MSKPIKRVLAGFVLVALAVTSYFPRVGSTSGSKQMGQNRGRYIGERIAEQQSGFYTGVGWHHLHWPSSLAAINDKIAKSIERSARRSLVTGPKMAAYLSVRSAKLEAIL